jgi:phage gp29-like protein
MLRVVRGAVRDRWLASQLSYFTPQIVENTARGAMSGNLLAQWLMFDLMEQTWPRLSKNLNEIKGAVTDLDWNIQAFALRGEKPSAEAQRRAKVAEQLIWQMKPDADADEADFEDTLYNVMDALGKGISVSETHWMAPGEPGNEMGLWWPRATRWVHPRYYGYSPLPGTEDRLMLNMMEVRLSNPDAGQAIQQQAVAVAEGALGMPDGNYVNGQLYARFPRDQFIISVMKQKSGHPVSGAMLRILGFWWAASNFSWEWFLNLAQIFGVPLRWTNYSSTAPPGTITAIGEMMANLGSAGWAAFPEGVKVNIEKALEGARDNPSKAFIDASDIICDIVILGQTLTTSQGERGSQALGTIHKTVRDERITAVARRTAKVLNTQFLPALCRLNFGDDQECPWFQPSTKETKDLVNAATRYKTLLSIPGIQISKQQFYEENDLMVPDKKDDVIVGQIAAPAFGGQATEEDDNPNPAAGGKGTSNLEPSNHRTSKATAQAADATEQLTNHVLEDLTGVEAKWLGGVKPFFRRLCATAMSSKVSDAEFVQVIEKARREMPELFDKLDGKAVATALEASMGSAAVNGAVKGFLKRET